ncbi:MAG: FAD-dependent oxidoreductase [Burkholderiaceae bacterium]|nr:FAD-dependent oxidoreductase [Burkholderiaceae bacterium]
MTQELKNNIHRTETLSQLKKETIWDVVVMGSSTVGLGIALDAASRGFSTLLLDDENFNSSVCNGSSRLLMPNLSLLATPKGWKALAKELHECRLLLDNAPQVVTSTPVIMPFYKNYQREVWFVLLTLVSKFSRSFFGHVSWLSQTEVIRRLPGIEPSKLVGGILLNGAVVNVVGLRKSLLKTAQQYGASFLDSVSLNSFKKNDKGEVSELIVDDVLSGEKHSIHARLFFNATNVRIDEVRHLIAPEVENILKCLQTTQITVDAKCFDGSTPALFVESLKSSPLECIPWNGMVQFGPQTDPCVSKSDDSEENTPIDLLLEKAKRVMLFAPTKKNIKKVSCTEKGFFCRGNNRVKASGIHTEFKNVISVADHDFANYRKLAEQALSEAVECGLLYKRPCSTSFMSLSRLENLEKE